MNEPDEPEPPADPPKGTPQPVAADSAKLASADVPEGSDTARAFISYASADSSIANAVCSALEREGVKCWIAPRDVTPGELYAGNIVHAIDTTRVVVLVLSQHAADSGHVLREVERASSKRHPIVSFRIDLTPLPDDFAYFLNTSQWLDASATGIDRALPRLVDAVKSALGKTAIAVRVAENPPVKIKAGRRPSHILLPLAVIVAGVLTYFVADRLWLSKREDPQKASVEATSAKPADPSGAPTIPARSIAVLPFADMSAEKDQEYMSDGIAEEILNLLAQVPDLQVIARTSSFAFKGQNIEVTEIAKRLNVAHVLEGSVRTSEDKLRITAQLVRTADSTHLWSERYDRPMGDIFAVQDEIANAIVQALQIRLKGGTLNRRAGGTQNLEAYQIYLRAVSATNQSTKASLDVAEDYAEQATKLDPQFGLAWFQLARVAAEKVAIGSLATKTGYERVEQFTQRALQLSPDIAAAHAMLHELYLVRDFNLPAAKVELQRALALDPTNTQAVTSSAMMSATLGEYDEAERQIRAAMQRDPLDLNLGLYLVGIYSGTGRLAEAEKLVRSLIKHQPDREWIHANLARILLVQGKVDAALTALEGETNEGARIAVMPMILHASGRQAEAEEALKVQIKFWADEYAQGIAMTYAYMGDHDRAMEWLERAYQQKDSSLYNIVDSPLYSSLAQDPRYKAFLRDRLKLPV